ncbi:MAG: hypothetical protein RL095_457 [Verrucomicrobiota bacterium]|jgi:phosphatidylserine/phosphatidylglycerophosphate/cardiolipin synthase-like enzyme
METLHQLSDAALDGLARALRSGALAQGLGRQALQSFAGPSLAPRLLEELRQLESDGFGPAQLAVLVEEVARARSLAQPIHHILDLVLSGPEAPGVPVRDTSVVFNELVEEAQGSMLIAGYAFYQGKEIFARLAAKHDADPAFELDFCLDISRKPADSSRSEDIVTRARLDFLERNWPGRRPPRLWHDPRSLLPEAKQRSSLHAKCVLVDSCLALVTSANFTQAAQRRNIEAGLILRHAPSVLRLESHFRQLIERGVLQRG